MQRLAALALPLALLSLAYGCASKLPRDVESNPAALAQQAPERSFEHRIEANARDMLKEGKRVFRYDTFGSEAFWGGKGLFVREKGGFYHDGRFEDLNQVIAHYSRVLNLSLSEGEKADLIQFLKSL